MEYLIRRGEEHFGPYTLSDLQRYVQSGNIAMNDLAKSDGMADWIPVSQVLGDIPAELVAPVASPATQSIVEPTDLVPLPPNLHWGVLLLLCAVTFTIFNSVWAIVLANWARKLSKNNKPLLLVVFSLAAFFLVGGLATIPNLGAVLAILRLGGGIVFIWGVFTIKAAMEDYYNSQENIGLSLSGVMTFFFSIFYFQYHINRIARWKKTGILEGGSLSSSSLIRTAIDYHKDTRLGDASDPDPK